ncbi:hypothetical protein EDC04DRAFT_2581978 [Pisolithus marmoratus]|nr:hypothetical protein EDC04DRAFT_2581978 [Pisolithus marmoratus]
MLTVPALQGNWFFKVKSFIAVQGDKCKVGAHVIVKLGNAHQIGVIKEILVPFEQHLASHIVISLLEFLPELHPHLHVPCIRYPVQEQKIVVPPLDVICVVNVQHDCITSSCTSTRTVLEKQEHLVTLRTKDLIDHAPTNAYIINTSLLHNYQWIKAVVPSMLYDQVHASSISDHISLCLHAADLLWSKKGKGGETGGTANCDDTSPAEQPAFDHWKKTRGKGKEIAKASPIQPTIKTANSNNSSSSNVCGTHMPTTVSSGPSQYHNSLNLHVPTRPPVYAPMHSINPSVHGPPAISYNPPQAGPSMPYGVSHQIHYGASLASFQHPLPPQHVFSYPPHLSGMPWNHNDHFSYSSSLHDHR